VRSRFYLLELIDGSEVNLSIGMGFYAFDRIIGLHDSGNVADINVSQGQIAGIKQHYHQVD
jgi:hypothetical protein